MTDQTKTGESTSAESNKHVHGPDQPPEAEEPKVRTDKKEKREPTIDDAQFSAAIDDILGKSKIPNAAELLSLYQIAEKLWQSGMFSRHKNAAGVFAVILYGVEIGLSYMQSLMNIDIIEGSPAMSTQLMAAIFKSRGGQIAIIRRDETECRLRLTWRGQTEEFVFSQVDVERAELSGRNTHQKYPVAMKYWRALSDGIKTVAPDCLLRAYTHDELTNGAAASPDQYARMIADQSKEEPFSRQPHTTTAAPGNKPQGRTSSPAQPTLASAMFIKQIRELLEGPVVPPEFKERTEVWLTNNEGRWLNDDAARAHRLLQKFTPSTSRANLEPATKNQLGFLSSSVQSDSLPDHAKNAITAAFCGSQPATKGAASAWIAVVEWYKTTAEKKAKQHSQPADPGTGADGSSPDDPPLPSGPDPDDLRDRIRALCQSRDVADDEIAGIEVALGNSDITIEDLEGLIEEIKERPIRPKPEIDDDVLSAAVGKLTPGKVTDAITWVEKMIWIDAPSEIGDHRESVTGSRFLRSMKPEQRQSYLVDLVREGRSRGLDVKIPGIE